jgi:hypothetical protein
MDDNGEILHISILSRSAHTTSSPSPASPGPCRGSVHMCAKSPFPAKLPCAAAGRAVDGPTQSYPRCLGRPLRALSIH